MGQLTIRLQRAAWDYDPATPLGRRGGFGAVFQGRDEAGQAVAVKKLHLTAEAAGHREMDMAAALAARSLRNVMPILDWGADANGGGYFIVMPKAEGSLQGRLSQGPLPEDEAIAALLDIARGLDEVRDIVHRDLKPDNVLRFGGRWVVADFGIAKFVEASTSLHTLRGCLTPHYAAPEQWRSEAPTSATDVYALGCVAVALLTGRPPFDGRDDLQGCHLQEAPPTVPATPALRQLVAACLRKPAGARPGLRDAVEQLERARSTAVRHDPIVAAGAVIAERAAKEDAQAVRKQSRDESRAELARIGRAVLLEIRSRLFDDIIVASPMARRMKDSSVGLGDGVLTIESRFASLQAGTFEHSGWDVIAGWVVKVSQTKNARYRERSANLWYADPNKSGSYRWFESGHWEMKAGAVTRDEPFAIERADQLRDADFALSNVLHSVNVTPRPPRPIDGTGEEWFSRRWRTWLAEAATSSMSYPSHLPEGS